MKKGRKINVKGNIPLIKRNSFDKKETSYPSVYRHSSDHLLSKPTPGTC